MSRGGGPCVGVPFPFSFFVRLDQMQLGEYRFVYLSLAASTIFAVVLISCTYLDDHVSSAIITVITVALIGAYLLAIVIAGIVLVVFVLRGTTRRAVATAISLFVLASTPLWSGYVYTLIDVLRFYYSYDFDLAKSREAAADASGNKLLVIDWGSGGSVISSRMNSLIYVEGPSWTLPSAPDRCEAKFIHISGNFYSMRIVC